MDQDINFTLNLVDNLSATMNRVERSVETLDGKMDGLANTTQAQSINFMSQVTAMRSVDMGLRGLVNVGAELGIVGGGTLRVLRGMSLAVHGISSAFQLLKGARQIILMLRSAEIGLASVETYRAVLKSPAKMGLVIAGLSIAAGAAGYLAGASSVDNSSTSTTVNFSGSSGTDKRAMTRETLESLGGY